VVSKRCGYSEQIHWFRVDERQILVKGYTVSKLLGFVWTWPELGKQNIRTFLKMIQIQNNHIKQFANRPPTPPLNKTTLTLTSHLGQTVGSGER